MKVEEYRKKVNKAVDQLRKVVVDACLDDDLSTEEYLELKEQIDSAFRKILS